MIRSPSLSYRVLTVMAWSRLTTAWQALRIRLMTTCSILSALPETRGRSSPSCTEKRLVAFLVNVEMSSTADPTTAFTSSSDAGAGGSSRENAVRFFEMESIRCEQPAIAAST